MPTPRGAVVVLQIIGAVDAATISVLHGGLADAFARYPTHVVVDIAKMTSCSVDGLRVLLDGQVVAVAYRASYAVAGLPSSCVDRVWARMCQLDDQPRRFATAQDGVRAARDATWPMRR